MDEQSNRGPRKRTHGDSSDESSTEDVVENKKISLMNGVCKEAVSGKEARFFNDRKVPFFRESSINEILKVVSLQSFSNPRIHGLSIREEKYVGEEIKRSIGETTPLSGRDSPVNNGIESGCLSVRVRAKRGEKNTNTSGEKDERYWEKRERNNASAKRSRDARRVRELETQIRAEFLEEENHRYKVENQMLREENTRLLKIVEESKYAS